MGFMALPLWVPITGFLVKVYMEAVPSEARARQASARALGDRLLTTAAARP